MFDPALAVEEVHGVLATGVSGGAAAPVGRVVQVVVALDLLGEQAGPGGRLRTETRRTSLAARPGTSARGRRSGEFLSHLQL
jgi:hypothetical protein